MINFTAGPTVKQFLDSRKFIKVIEGPVGGGKSTAALFDLFSRSVNQKPFRGVRTTRHIILRNTIQQLNATVKPLLDAWFITMPPTPLGEWQLTDRAFHMRFMLSDGTQVNSEFWLMAADTPDDVRRLLSLECSAAWAEECREVDPEVFEGLSGRVARFPSRAAGGVTYPGVIGSTNPPPLGTYWQENISSPPDNWGVFIQPPAVLEDGGLNPEAENLENLDPDYYSNIMIGKTQPWIDVYLRNQFGAGEFGNPVFKASFVRSFHTMTGELKPVLQSVNPLVIGMDNGLTAAAVIGQQDARGRINVFDTAQVPEGETMGVETFLDRNLIPKLVAEYSFRKENIVFVLDPACFQRSQVDEKTIAQAIIQRGYRVLRANTNDPERRVSAVEGLLARQIDGKAGVMLGPKAAHLANALEWGYRYKKTSLVPEKNWHSHIADAFQYFCLFYNSQETGSYWRKNNEAKPVVRRRYAYS